MKMMSNEDEYSLMLQIKIEAMMTYRMMVMVEGVMAVEGMVVRVEVLLGVIVGMVEVMIIIMIRIMIIMMIRIMMEMIIMMMVEMIIQISTEAIQI